MRAEPIPTPTGCVVLFREQTSRGGTRNDKHHRARGPRRPQVGWSAQLGHSEGVPLMSAPGVVHGNDLSPSGAQPTEKARSSAGASHLAVNLLVWAGSLLLASSAVLHFHLWDSEGYRNIPTIGPLFLAQAIVGVVLALATAILRQLVLVIAAAGLAVSSIGGLLIAVWWGLFGWQESFAAPYVGLALWIEAGAAVLLGAACLVLGLPWLAAVRSTRAKPGRSGELRQH
jgi:hypothetical protein